MTLRASKRGKCSGCGCEGFYVEYDPYDVVANSSYLLKRYFCLGCYNEKVIAALLWVQSHPMKGNT